MLSYLYSSSYCGSQKPAPNFSLFARCTLRATNACHLRRQYANASLRRPKLIDYLIEPFTALVCSSIDLPACFQHPQHPMALASLIAGSYKREESRLLWPSTVCAFRQPDGDEVSHYETSPSAHGSARLSMLSTPRILLYALYLVRFYYTYVERRDEQSAARSAV
jgi:hypothetical protein